MPLLAVFTAASPTTGLNGFIASCESCRGYLIEHNSIWHHMNDRCPACFGPGYSSPDPDCPLALLHGEHNQFTPGLGWRTCDQPIPALCAANRHCKRPLDVEWPCLNHDGCCGLCCEPN